MGFSVRIKGLDELQKKLARFPDEAERIRREVMAQYATKIEQEAKEACATTEMKESIKIIPAEKGNFNVRCSDEAKQYVNPVVERNKAEMVTEIKRRISESWRT